MRRQRIQISRVAVFRLMLTQRAANEGQAPVAVHIQQMVEHGAHPTAAVYQHAGNIGHIQGNANNRQRRKAVTKMGHLFRIDRMAQRTGDHQTIKALGVHQFIEHISLRLKTTQSLNTPAGQTDQVGSDLIEHMGSAPQDSILIAIFR